MRDHVRFDTNVPLNSSWCMRSQAASEAAGAAVQ